MTLELSEKDLITKAQKDPQAFGLIFDKYYQVIFQYTLRRVNDVALAQDLTSNVFLKAYKSLWRFRWQGVPFVAWLYRIANNEVKSHFRGERKRAISLEDLREESGWEPAELKQVDEEMIHAEEEIERYWQYMEVQSEIAKLDEKYQEVLHLRFFEHLKIAEIGKILGKNPGTIKSLVSRGLSKLRVSINNRQPQTTESAAPAPISQLALSVAPASTSDRVVL